MNQDGACMALPPGYRFHPMDEEIITHYLWEKVLDNGFSARAIGEVDLNKCEPWDLSSKAKMGESEWYFFCQRDRKYPTGMRTNRATESGYWKATGKDKEIYKGRGNLVGMKKTLVFYMGRAPKGEKTNWVMHEYRLDGNYSYPNPAAKNEWVVCKVFHKSNEVKRTYDETNILVRTNSFSFNSSMVDELLIESPTLPPLVDTTNHLINIGNTSTQPFSSFNHYDHQVGVNTQNLMGPNPNLYFQTSFDSYMGNMDFNLHQDKNSCFDQCYSDLENLWKG